ncbi:MAG: folylpolyglutamate synthase/dihydrofolate synthase family protein [Thermodesulfovibrionales bacterium]|nr:folylpolyglutamate synthase/dihydrofolate synthase family protein [Thermodesulfovibrionales bacterium]
MAYGNAISYLYGLQKHGIKLGLDNALKLSVLLGNPQDSFRKIHVAGTNGKGSTSAITASVLKASGKRAGLFTSPHLVSFTERIRVNGREIKEEEVVSLTDEIREKIRGGVKDPDFSPTFFEFVTAMGFVYFKRQEADWAVVETGMGGRLDATNIILPEVSVITPVALDHREFLGGSLKEIAAEKAGIIKQGVPIVSAAQEPDAIDVIERMADRMGAPLHLEGRDFRVELKGHGISGIYLDYSSSSLNLSGIGLPLAGAHQAHNAGLAIKAAELVLGAEAGDKIKEGLSAVLWPGRLQRISASPEIFIDGAHNPAAARALSETLKEEFVIKGRRIVLVMGIMADKDAAGIMEPLLPLASHIIFAAPAYERAARPEELKRQAASMGYESRTADSVKGAIDAAAALGGPVVITGSFYTAGEAMEAMGVKGVLTGLRE